MQPELKEHEKSRRRSLMLVPLVLSVGCLQKELADVVAVEKVDALVSSWRCDRLRLVMIVESAVCCGGRVHHHCSSSLKWTWGPQADLEFSACHQHNPMYSSDCSIPQPTAAAHDVCRAVEVPQSCVASTDVAIMETVP